MAPQPLYVYPGQIPNPNVQYGQADMTNAPVTFARIAFRWGDVQLSNGLDRMNYSNIQMMGKNGRWNIAMVPTIAGQSRLSGTGQQTTFPMQGPSPSQWSNHVSGSAGSQPQYPGGPGQVLGMLQNPGTG
jgi:hypothetical protein